MPESLSLKSVRTNSLGIKWPQVNWLQLNGVDLWPNSKTFRQILSTRNLGLRYWKTESVRQWMNLTERSCSRTKVRAMISQCHTQAEILENRKCNCREVGKGKPEAENVATLLYKTGKTASASDSASSPAAAWLNFILCLGINWYRL